MTNQDLVEIVAVVDRSGPMDMMKKEAIGGFNDFLQEQKELPGQADFTLVLFDHEYQLRYDGVDIQAVEPFDKNSYSPRGTTALLDAIGRTIDDVGNRLSNTPESERPRQVIVCILTDGMENASKDYTKDRIQEMVNHQQDVYNWEFIFLAAGLDAVRSGDLAGLSAQTHAVAGTGQGIKQAYSYTTRTVSQMRTDYDSDDE